MTTLYREEEKKGGGIGENKSNKINKEKGVMVIFTTAIQDIPVDRVRRDLL